MNQNFIVFPLIWQLDGSTGLQSLQDLKGHGFDAVERLDGRRQDLIGRQKESASSGVAQFQGVRVQDALLVVGEVGSAAGCQIC